MVSITPCRGCLSRLLHSQQAPRLNAFVDCSVAHASSSTSKKLVPRAPLQAEIHLPASDSRKRRRMIHVRAAAASSPSSIKFPESREAAISQAAEALNRQIVSKKAKQKVKATGAVGSLKKFAVEVPVQDQSAAAAVALARDLLQELDEDAGEFTAVFGDGAAAALAQESLPRSVSLAAARGVIGPVLLVAPLGAQIAELEAFMEDWRGRTAILLNAEFGPADLSNDARKQLVAAFEFVYCFQPLAIQGFLSTQEGMVFKWVEKGSPAAVPWNIYVAEKDGSFSPVGRMQRRPDMEEVQVALYNQQAVKSPLTKGVDFLAGLIGKKK